MKFARARPVADAILYEGYALYPYRASSVKNQRRWMFGTLFPRDAADAHGEPWRMRCVCLLEAPESAEIEAIARFLRFEARASEVWEEAAPEEVRIGPVRVDEIARRPRRERVSMAAARALGADGIERSRRAIEGEIEIAAEQVSAGILRLIVTITNLTPCAAEGARLASMASAHALVAVRGGAFASLVDPPAHLAEAAESCRNSGAWPVLAGRPGEHDLVLCSPIILADHPAIAPESQGDLFDGTEMDEMLTLRILTMTDAEKREAAAVDDRVRAMIERTEALGADQIARMHGAVRRFASVTMGETPNPPARPVGTRGRLVVPGDHVRLHPRGRSDILDLALDGMDATVVSIEQDYEDRIFVTVTVDEDPGRDLGAKGLPGHRFFFRPEEIELLDRGLDRDPQREGAR